MRSRILSGFTGHFTFTLARFLLRANRSMGDYTLVVAGMQFEKGPGFIVSASTGRAGELLLDSSCAIARN
jgi:hypothetical protein